MKYFQSKLIATLWTFCVQPSDRLAVLLDWGPLWKPSNITVILHREVYRGPQLGPILPRGVNEKHEKKHLKKSQARAHPVLKNVHKPLTSHFNPGKLTHFVVAILICFDSNWSSCPRHNVNFSTVSIFRDGRDWSNPQNFCEPFFCGRIFAREWLAFPGWKFCYRMSVRGCCLSARWKLIEGPYGNFRGAGCLRVAFDCIMAWCLRGLRAAFDFAWCWKHFQPEWEIFISIGFAKQKKWDKNPN